MWLRDQRLNKQLVCGALSPAEEKPAEPNRNLTRRTEPIPTETYRTESDRKELHRTDLQITSAVAAAMLARVRKITLVFASFKSGRALEPAASSKLAGTVSNQSCVFECAMTQPEPFSPV